MTTTSAGGVVGPVLPSGSWLRMIVTLIQRTPCHSLHAQEELSRHGHTVNLNRHGETLAGRARTQAARVHRGTNRHGIANAPRNTRVIYIPPKNNQTYNQIQTNNCKRTTNNGKQTKNTNKQTNKRTNEIIGNK